MLSLKPHPRRHRLVTQLLLILFLQQAMFATGTMAGSLYGEGGWVTLCVGDSDVVKLVYLGEEGDQHHGQGEQCSFSALGGAVSSGHHSLALTTSATLLFDEYSHVVSSAPSSNHPARAPPRLLS